MSKWNILKNAIAEVIRKNENKEITGAVLQSVLYNIITCVGENSTFAGIANPKTNPGISDGNIFYLATEAGTYSNFSGITIKAGEAVILEWRDGQWKKNASGFATQEYIDQIKKEIDNYTSKINASLESINANKQNNLTFDALPVLKSSNPVTSDGIRKALDEQKSEVELAKDEAIQAIRENEQGAISNFNKQKVTPEMLSEATKQFIQSSGGGTITNFPDDEDIESKDDESGIKVLKLATRKYNSENFSGKGYKILRKNIVSGKNILTQDMIDEANTIYEVRYDFNLDGNTLHIQDGCILKFTGGSIANGDIAFNNTVIIDGNFIDINFSGYIENKDIYLEWFKNSNGNYDTEYLKRFINSSNNIDIKRYYIGNRHIYVKSLSISNCKNMYFIGGTSSIIEVDPTINRYNWEECWTFKYCENITFENIHFTAPQLPSTNNNPLYASMVLRFKDCANVLISRCIFDEMPYISPIYFGGCVNLRILNNTFNDYDSGIINLQDNTEELDEKIYSVYIQNNYFGGEYVNSEPITITTNKIIKAEISNNYISNKKSASGISIQTDNENSFVYIHDNIITNNDTGIICRKGTIAYIINNIFISNTSGHINANDNASIYCISNYFEFGNSLFLNQELTDRNVFCRFINNIISNTDVTYSRADSTKLEFIGNQFKGKNVTISFKNDFVFVNNVVENGIKVTLSPSNTEPVKCSIYNNTGNVSVSNLSVSKITEDSVVELGDYNNREYSNSIPVFYNKVFYESVNPIISLPINKKGFILDLIFKYTGTTTQPPLRADAPVYNLSRERIYKNDIVNLRMLSLGNGIYQVLQQSILTKPLTIRTKTNDDYSVDALLNGTINKEDIYGIHINYGKHNFIIALDFYYGKWSSIEKDLTEIDGEISNLENNFSVEELNNKLESIDQSDIELLAYNYCKNYKAHENDIATWLHATGGYISIVNLYMGIITKIFKFLEKEISSSYCVDIINTSYYSMACLYFQEGLVREINKTNTSCMVIPMQLITE